MTSNRTPSLKVLRGIPASGKSTYAEKWVAEDPENRVRINRDSIRQELWGNMSAHVGEDKVTKAEQKQLHDSLASGKDVISDNTNTNTKFLPNLIKTAESYGATVSHKDFPITLKEAIKRNNARDRVVPEHVLRNMHSRLGPQGQFPVFPGSYPVKPLVLPKKRTMAIMFDMDGSLNDVRGVLKHITGENPKTGRRNRDWDSFHRMSEFEPANEEVLQMAKDAHAAGFTVLITTARAEEYRETTQKWCDDHGVPYTNIFMRPSGDHRPDYEIKKEMFEKINMYYDVVRAVDDNPQAIQAWKEKGIAVTEIPFVNDLSSNTPVTINNVFRTGGCVRCGKPLKSGGPLGPTCKLR